MSVTGSCKRRADRVGPVRRGGWCCNRTNALWVVQEFPFTPGTYEIGVSEGLMTIMLDRCCKDHYKRPDNKQRQSMFRDYRKYFR